MTKDTGGQAFPCKLKVSKPITEFKGSTDSFEIEEFYQGMTLRDYFAGQVVRTHPLNMYEYEAIASYCYKMADAMIELLESGEMSEAYSKNGRRIAESEYSLESFASKTLDAYRSVISDG